MRVGQRLIVVGQRRQARRRQRDLARRAVDRVRIHRRLHRAHVHVRRDAVGQRVAIGIGGRDLTDHGRRQRLVFVVAEGVRPVGKRARVAAGLLEHRVVVGSVVIGDRPCRGRRGDTQCLAVSCCARYSGNYRFITLGRLISRRVDTEGSTQVARCNRQRLGCDAPVVVTFGRRATQGVGHDRVKCRGMTQGDGVGQVPRCIFQHAAGRYSDRNARQIGLAACRGVVGQIGAIDPASAIVHDGGLGGSRLRHGTRSRDGQGGGDQLESLRSLIDPGAAVLLAGDAYAHIEGALAARMSGGGGLVAIAAVPGICRPVHTVVRVVDAG